MRDSFLTSPLDIYDLDASYNDIHAIKLIQGHSLESKLFTLNTCDCCSRHTINKPSIFKVWHNTQFIFKPNKLNLCPCNCRHLARIICRNC